MQYTSRFSRNALAASIAAVVCLAGALAAWPYISANVSSLPFMPHRTCYMNDPGLIWLHVISDSLIGIAYVSISLTLAYLVQVTRVPFHLAFIAFGVFIGACGGTHFMEVWTVWEPHYWLAGGLKVVTALASVVTAVWLFPLLPQARMLVRGAELAEERRVELEKTNSELQLLYKKVTELDELKTQFFANVSHELRTPLALIMGPAEKLSRSEHLSASQRQDLAVISRNARMLLRHVNDLLDIAKLDARKLELSYSEADAARLVRAICSQFEVLARERNITFGVEAPDALSAQMDSGKIERVLLNLLSNAFKFTPENGTIRCTVQSHDGKLRVAVQDSGPGIKPEHRDAVFERFRQLEGGSTRKFGGTGLGLSIVREFVGLHSGKISVGNSPFGGAELSFVIPLHAPAEVRVSSADQDQARLEDAAEQAVAELRPALNLVGSIRQAPPNAPLVLIAEDNADMRQLISEELKSEYRVITAPDGDEAFKQAENAKPDIIISDVMMPRISGEDLLRIVRKTKVLSHIPVIMLTAKADSETRLYLLNEGASDYLVKPVLMDELKARVRNFVMIKRTRDVLESEVATRSDDLESLARVLSTRKRELEAARQELERISRAKDEFLATLSHELRTPLTAVLGWTRLLQSNSLDPAASQRALNTIERNARAQAKLIEELLDMSRIISGKMKLETAPLDLAQVVEAALETMRPAIEAKNINLESRIVRSRCLIQGDAVRLQQAVWNLISNAVKFTPPGGKIGVCLDSDAREASLSISDNGAGIDANFLPHLFERFRQADGTSTRKYGGLGLGLAIVRHLIELHGGSVSAYSAGANCGATFTIKLPLLAVDGNRENTEVPAVSKALPSLAGIKVVIVEDDLDTRDLLESVLRMAGAQVFTAESSEEALAAVERNAPDVMLSDIGMPHEDGYVLIGKLRSRPPERGGRTPAIAVTAYVREEDRRKLVAAGFQAHLPKPIDPQKIAQTILEFARHSEERSDT